MTNDDIVWFAETWDRVHGLQPPLVRLRRKRNREKYWYVYACLAWGALMGVVALLVDYADARRAQQALHFIQEKSKEIPELRRGLDELEARHPPINDMYEPVDDR